MKNVHVHIRQEDLQVSPTEAQEMKASRAKRRLHELLTKAAESHSTGNPTAADKTGTSPSSVPHTSGMDSSSSGSGEGLQSDRHLHFDFFRSPAEILKDASGAVSGVRLQRMALESGAEGQGLTAVGELHLA